MVNRFYKQDMGDFIVTPGMLNHMGILHGGELIKHLDSSLGVFVRDYNGTNAVTGRIERLSFDERSHVGDHINFTVSLLKTTRNTMVVYAAANRIEIGGNKVQIGEAVFTFVAVDLKFNILPVKPYEPSDPEICKFTSDTLKRFNLKK